MTSRNRNFKEHWSIVALKNYEENLWTNFGLIAPGSSPEGTGRPAPRAPERAFLQAEKAKLQIWLSDLAGRVYMSWARLAQLMPYLLERRQDLSRQAIATPANRTGFSHININRP